VFHFNTDVVMGIRSSSKLLEPTCETIRQANAFLPIESFRRKRRQAF